MVPGKVGRVMGRGASIPKYSPHSLELPVPDLYFCHIPSNRLYVEDKITP